MANEISRLFVAIGAKTDEFHKGMDGVQSKMDKISKRMKIAGGIMVGAIAAIGVASLKMAADFDGAMREVNTMMLLNEDEFRVFSKDVQNLARDMGVNAVEAAKALYQAISAGVPRENAIDFLTIATKAAIGGVTDTKTAVDGLTTVINAFKLPMSDAQKVADVMFTTVKGGKTTFNELSASLFQVAPIAAASGVEFEEVAAALATMTKQGVPTTVATTQLRQAMVALQKPTADMNKVIESLGYESGQAMLEELGLAKSLDVLRNATDGNNEMLMKMFGSVEAGAAVLALTGENAAMFADDLDAMENSAGAATDAFEQMEQSTGRQFEKLKVQFQDIAITIGTALMPALTKILKAITPIITKLGEWISEHPKLTTIILASVGALGALMLLASPLLNMIKLMTIAIHSQKIAMVAHKVASIAMAVASKIAAAAQWILNAAMTANPIGLIIVAIGALVVGIIALIRNWDKVVTLFRGPAYRATKELEKAMKDLADTMLTDISGAAQEVKDEFQSLIDFLSTEEYKQYEVLSEEQLERIRKVNPELADQLGTLMAQIKAQDKLIVGYNEQERAAREAIVEAKLGEPELPEEERIQLLSELAGLQRTTYVTDWHRLLDENKGILIIALGDQMTEWDEYFQGINDGWDGTRNYLENTIIPAYNKLVTEGFLSPTTAEDLIEDFKKAVEDWRIDIAKAIGLPEVAVTGKLGGSYGPPKEEALQLVPRLQFGGIARSPTLAMVGEGGPEAVIPLDRLGSVSNKTTEMHIHIGNFMGDEISLRKLQRRLQQIGGEEVRRTQFSPIQGGDYYDSGRASI